MHSKESYNYVNLNMNNELMAKKKQRLDIRIKELGLAPSRSKAQALVMAGSVLVNQKPVSKAGYLVSDDDEIILKGRQCPYVSRGGLKLEAALEHFDIDVTGKICIDVGASTGGFTHCLLQKGATLVYAIDVGYGQLDWSLRNRKEVINLEKTNIRYVSPELFDPPPELATVDVSFISLKVVMPAILSVMTRKAGDIIALIKPQFEAGPSKVGKGGVVRSEQVRKEVIRDLIHFFSETLGLLVHGVIESPIKGIKKGNKEYLIYLTKGEGSSPCQTQTLT